MRYRVALLGVAALWGATFLITKDALGALSPLNLLFWRFLLATIVLLPWMAHSIKKRPTKGALKRGVLLGGVLAAGYLLQTSGVALTLSGDAGLLTGLFVVFTPLGGWLFLKQRVSKQTSGLVALALLGTSLLLFGNGSDGVGNMLVIGGAIAFSAHLLLVGKLREDAPITQTTLNLVSRYCSLAH